MIRNRTSKHKILCLLFLYNKITKSKFVKLSEDNLIIITNFGRWVMNMKRYL